MVVVRSRAVVPKIGLHPLALASDDQKVKVPKKQQPGSQKQTKLGQPKQLSSTPKYGDYSARSRIVDLVEFTRIN